MCLSAIPNLEVAWPALSTKAQGSLALFVSRHLQRSDSPGVCVTLRSSLMLGIVLACANMTVYLADRTGVIGSKAFNIHKVRLPRTLSAVHSTDRGTGRRSPAC